MKQRPPLSASTMERLIFARNKILPGDPVLWNGLIALLFFGLVTFRLGIPSRIYFDEIHYVPAARKLLALTTANPEHPLFGKEMIAAAIALFGDRPIVWRIPSVLFGTLGLFAFGRMLWWASLSRYASLAGQYLLLTGFAWYVQSRIAMLDMVMAGLAMTALWLLASAVRNPGRYSGHIRLAAAGLCLGLALGAKWSVAPLVVLPGIVFLICKLRDHQGALLTSSTGGAVPGVSLLTAGLWLGLLPLLVYWATYLPAFFYHDRPISPWAFFEHHRKMLDLQESVVRLHPYRSVWYQWVANIRGLWFLYEPVNGAQRGILLIGNPFTMLAGLPAVLWCLWAGVYKKQTDTLAMGGCYVVTLGMWIVSSKPIQFYYHYLLPSTFLIACLALMLSRWHADGGKWRWASWGALMVSCGMFLWFWPVLSAAPLAGKAAFAKWMWLSTWR